MRLEDLKNKKIAIVGLGVNNQKMADYFRNRGINFDVFGNWKHPDDLIGKLDNYNIIFRTPGLPFLSKAVQQAKSKGVEISSQTKLFFQLCSAKIIGVTGTKGKGTTASLIAKILESAGKKVWLAGNIGSDPFEFLDKIHPDDLVIYELSSFQLQDLEQSPYIAVVLKITSDHLNHHQSVEEYRQAKLNIIAHQTEKDFAVLHPTESLAAGFETKLLGRHNLENIAAALAVAKILGIDQAISAKIIAEFEALPHRLKAIREIQGVTYIDDAFSTNIEPTMAAIDSIDSSLILIIGGYDKGLDFGPLIEKINNTKKIKAAVVIGDVANQIAPKLTGKVFTGAKNMQEILTQAQSLADSGDTILFSPATSSFDMFKNELDRGEQFVNAVRAL